MRKRSEHKSIKKQRETTTSEEKVKWNKEQTNEPSSMGNLTAAVSDRKTDP